MLDSMSVMPVGAPAPVLEVSHTEEWIEHEEQIINRPWADERKLVGWAALGMSPGARGDLRVHDGGIAPIGKYTWFSLRRSWSTGRSERAVIAIILAGYKARLQDGVVVMGTSYNNACAFDLRFRPHPDAGRTGKIISSRNRTALSLGLALDKATESVMTGNLLPHTHLTLPRFWAAFDLTSPILTTVEDSPAVRRQALRVIGPNYGGPIPASLQSPGGTVVCICSDAEGGIAIGFDGDEFNPKTVAVLPKTAVLRSYVRVGMSIVEGAELGDLVPRRMPAVARRQGSRRQEAGREDKI